MLEFAERLATAHPTIDDAFVTRLRSVFTDAEIVELGFVIGGFLMWGRLHRAFGVPPSGEGYHALLAKKSGA
jgi:alkylhydroperoxidase family enzyme